MSTTTSITFTSAFSLTTYGIVQAGWWINLNGSNECKQILIVTGNSSAMTITFDAIIAAWTDSNPCFFNGAFGGVIVDFASGECRFVKGPSQAVSTINNRL